MLLRARGVDVAAYDKVGGGPDARTSLGHERGGKKDAKAAVSGSPKGGERRGAAARVEEEEEEEVVAPSFWTMVGWRVFVLAADLVVPKKCDVPGSRKKVGKTKEWPHIF